MHDTLNSLFKKERMALSEQVGGDHYKKYPIQPIEFAMANGLNACQTLCLKYLMRYEDKNGPEDIDKAIHVLQLLKSIKYGSDEL